MDNQLTTKQGWEAVWEGLVLPRITDPGYDIQEQLEAYLPANDQHTFIEIGCAPGGWMAFFNKEFGFSVSGLEYAEVAAEATKTNMSMLNIDADILVRDFFSLDCDQNKYDVVFSGGFIEHFRDLLPVVQKVCSLSRQYVVTIVPNLHGINGCISKTFRPVVYAEHNPIEAGHLESLHQECGLETLFCDYVGGIRIIEPGKHSPFFDKHKFLARCLNAPVYLFNWACMKLGKHLSVTPRLRLFSDTIMYIGIKKEL